MSHHLGPASSSTAASEPARGVFSCLSWFSEGLRAALMLRPRWQRLQGGRLAAPLLLLLLLGLEAAFQWSWFPMEVEANPVALLQGWLPWLVLLWVCHALSDGENLEGVARAPGTARLFGVALVQVGVYKLFSLGLGTFLYHFAQEDWPLGFLDWLLWPGLLIAYGLALACLMIRAASHAGWALLGALAVIAAVWANSWHDDELMWRPHAEFTFAEPGSEAPPPQPQLLRLTQSLMERQPELLAERLEALLPQRPGVRDLYVLSFAPYALENVFRRESAMVTEVMTERFDAAGRSLQLVNNLDTLEEWPWATPLNLLRAIRHIASRMNLDEDLLFIHLSSHGALDGELAASFPPMTVETVSPLWLRAALDQAGVKNRVISVSACYSGSWVEPLADERTLVMTAADADNTSYGCGMLSELTFYGRAVFDEQLRRETRSFEKALAAARPIIEQREIDAGKDDGYSNPQIHVGEHIRPVLDELLQRLEP